MVSKFAFGDTQTIQETAVEIKPIGILVDFYQMAASYGDLSPNNNLTEERRRVMRETFLVLAGKKIAGFGTKKRI